MTGGLYTEDFGSSVTTTTKGNLIVVTDPAWTDPNNIDNTAGAVCLYRIDRESNSMKLDTLVKEDDCDGEFGSMTALQNEEDYRLFVGCPGRHSKWRSLLL